MLPKMTKGETCSGPVPPGLAQLQEVAGKGSIEVRSLDCLVISEDLLVELYSQSRSCWELQEALVESF